MPLKKRVLLIAFDFPPRRTSGIYRPTGLTKYLVRLGWEPTVLTVREGEQDLQDSTLLKRISPEVKVVRTKWFNLMSWEDSTAGAVRAVGALEPQPTTSQSASSYGYLRRFAAFARSCLYFPDDTVGWVPFGLAKAIELYRRQRFHVVYTTSPPRSSLAIGYFLKLLYGVPWVAEFRDPWYPPPRRIRAGAERRFLRLIGKKADAVVVMTTGHAREFSDLGIPIHKLKVVPNGFDEEDFDPHAAAAGNGLLAPGYVNLTFLGTVYPNCSGKFFEALKELVHERPELQAKVRVNIIGYPDEVVQRHATDEALRPVIRMHSFVDHDHSLELMRSSDCLLLFWANPGFARLAVAGKTYECLRSGRPILAITYAGPMKTIIENGKAGWAVHPEDKARMRQILGKLIAEGVHSQPNDSARMGFAAQFRYDRLAGKMAAIFEKVANHATG
jgi:glycosyltransferase involved in cell wall biosynthesis